MHISPFLTFVGDQCGKAQEAIEFYTSIFTNSEIKQVINYKPGEPGGAPDLIKYGEFVLSGILFKVSESNYNHAWSFSPAVSLFIDGPSEDEIRLLFQELSSNGGQVMVPLDNYGADNYGFGKLFGWCEDRYGVSWQLNLEE